MRCETYNEHPLYEVADIVPLADELLLFIPIRYQVLSVAFVTEETICSLHKQFLNDPTPTDVITFPDDEDISERTGEICISVDEALKYVHLHSLEQELTLYLVHGWLHLAGYDDLNEVDRRVMRTMEQKTLQFLSTQPVKEVHTRRKGAPK